MKKKTLVLIVGMHRSGTSALSGTLSTIGLNLGTDIVGKGVDNEKGFFENRYFLQFNKDLFKANNGDWQDIPSDIECSPEMKERLKNLLLQEFGDYDNLVIKDPRLTLLFRFYLEAAMDLQYNVKMLVMIRSASEIVESLMFRNKMEIGYAYELVAKYFYALLKIKYNHLTIKFDDLLINTIPVLQDLIQYLSLDTTIFDILNNVKEFIDEDLKHHDHGGN